MTTAILPGHDLPERTLRNADIQSLIELLQQQERHKLDVVVPVPDLAAIGVGRGPGPYTGLRVGLVHAEVLGWALGIPVHGVCSLDVLAADVLASDRLAGSDDEASGSGATASGFGVPSGWRSSWRTP